MQQQDRVRPVLSPLPCEWARLGVPEGHMLPHSRKCLQHHQGPRFLQEAQEKWGNQALPSKKETLRLGRGCLHGGVLAAC